MCANNCLGAHSYFIQFSCPVVQLISFFIAGLLAGITVTVVAVVMSLLGLVAVLVIIAMYKNGQPK